MGDRKKEATKIVFGNDKEIDDRKLKIKRIYAPGKNEFLINDDHEESRNIIKLMILEGASEEFVEAMIREAAEKGPSLTLDYLHCAALIMGEGYVREHLLGKTMSAEEASRKLREGEYEKQMGPLRQMYENLDGKIKAALDGEDQAKQQLEILKLQNTHAEEMYNQRLESAKLQFHYEQQLAEERARQKESNLQQTIREVRQSYDQEKERREELEMENGMLIRKLEKAVLELSAAAEKEKEKEKEAEQRAEKEEAPKETFLRRWRKAGFGKGDDAGREKAQKLEERRNFCISALGNSEYTEEQVNLILSCMMDESIPQGVLQYLCNPKLPVHNMRAMLRFLGGDEHVSKNS